jgi:2-methylcitrate dehydratase PrpD
MSVTQELVAHIVKTQFTDIDEVAVYRAKWRVLDVIGCIIGGAEAPGCRILLNLALEWGGAAQSQVLIHNVRLPSALAAMLNSLMARSYDFEPVEAEGIDITCPAHISGTTVSTALAVAERCSATGQDFLTALIVGDDLASRLAVSSGFSLDSGWDNTGTVNKFAAAAIAGKLFNLNEKQILAAWGLALHQCAGSMAPEWDRSLSYKIPIALASRDGIFAAELAAKDYPGVNDPLLGKQGFFALYCPKSDVSQLNLELGKRFLADRVIKPYPCCRSNHSFIDSALQIVRQNDINPYDIAEIEIAMKPQTETSFVGLPFQPGDYPQVQAAFSLRYTVACALLRKSVIPEHFTPEYVNSPEITDLIDKMTFRPVLPAAGEQSSAIRLKMADGQVFSAASGLAWGDIYHTPLSEADIIAKYRHNTAFSNALPASKTEKALSVILKLEELKDIRELIALLTK